MAKRGSSKTRTAVAALANGSTLAADIRLVITDWCTDFGIRPNEREVGALAQRMRDLFDGKPVAEIVSSPIEQP